VESLQARLESLRARTKDLPRVTVGCLEWLDPLMGSGNWGPELVRYETAERAWSSWWASS
jgi:iron complex transport system substrate-binding protein